MRKSQNSFQNPHKETNLTTVAKCGTLCNKVFHGFTSCSVALVGVCDIASRTATDLKRKITTLQNEVQSLEGIESRVFPLVKILETRNNTSPQNLDTTCRYSDSVAIELCKCAVAAESAIVFNVAESLTLQMAKLRIPVACNIFRYRCPCFRLQKNRRGGLPLSLLNS